MNRNFRTFLFVVLFVVMPLLPSVWQVGAPNFTFLSDFPTFTRFSTSSSSVTTAQTSVTLTGIRGSTSTTVHRSITLTGPPTLTLPLSTTTMHTPVVSTHFTSLPSPDFDLAIWPQYQVISIPPAWRDEPVHRAGASPSTSFKISVTAKGAFNSKVSLKLAGDYGKALGMKFEPVSEGDTDFSTTLAVRLLDNPPFLPVDLTINAEGGNKIKQVKVTVAWFVEGEQNFFLSALPNRFVMEPGGASPASVITVGSVNGFHAPVSIVYDWVGVMPSGISFSHNLDPDGIVIPEENYELKGTAYSQAILGQYTLRITGMCGQAPVKITHSVEVQVTLMPFYQLRVHAILTALDDGTDSANVNAQQIQDSLSFANEVYSLAGVRFTFDAKTDLQGPVKLTDLKVDLPKGANVAGLPDGFSQERANYLGFGGYNKGKIVIYYRNWVSNDPHYGPPSFSSANGRYIVLEASVGPRTFAHEVGHYLGLNHPFGGYHDAIYAKPTIQERLDFMKQLIKAEVESGKVSAADALNIFDGDLPSVTDTPPDEPALFGEGISGTVPGSYTLSNSPASVEFDVTFKDGTISHYVMQPDKNNIMGYYGGLPGSKHISNDQAKIVRDILENGSRKDLINP